MLLAVERVIRPAANGACKALVELEAHGAGHVLLALVDQGLEHLALGGEPEAVIDQLGIARHQIILQMRRAAIERDLLDAAMRLEEDRAARGFVDPARFHADETPLHKIEPADPVFAAKLVEPRQKRGRRELFAIDRDGIAPLEADFHIFGLIGRILGIDGALIHVIGRFHRRILEHLAL